MSKSKRDLKKKLQGNVYFYVLDYTQFKFHIGQKLQGMVVVFSVILNLH